MMINMEGGYSSVKIIRNHIYVKHIARPTYGMFTIETLWPYTVIDFGNLQI